MRPAEEMDGADRELRTTITRIWPLQAKKVLDLLIPLPPENVKPCSRMTVGKVYAGLLISENWKSTKFGKIKSSGLPVRQLFNFAGLLTRQECRIYEGMNKLLIY